MLIVVLAPSFIKVARSFVVVVMNWNLRVLVLTSFGGKVVIGVTMHRVTCVGCYYYAYGYQSNDNF